MFRSHDHPQEAYIVPCQSHNLKTLSDLLRYVSLVLWQHVCKYKYVYRIDCQSNIVRTEYYTQIICLYGLKRELCLPCVVCESYAVQNEPGNGCACAVSLNAIRHTTHIHSQARSEHRTTHTTHDMLSQYEVIITM